MATSPVLQIREWLVDQFIQIAPAGVLVHYAWPGAEQAGRQCIYFGSARTTRLEPAAHRATRYRREEDVVQSWFVAVHGDGMTQADADDHCLQIYGAVDEWASYTVNVQAAAAAATNQQVQSLRLSAWEQIQGPFDGGHGSALRASFIYTATYL